MLSSAQPAAPFWPSALVNTDFCTRRPKMMNATKTPSTTPRIGNRNALMPPEKYPATANAATITTMAPIMYGSRRLSSLR
ncbi:Uncharacterised protein [Mycobacteroides abscessus subsp. abscessus]|nr:Uncharacterised protein [Mycobacteroides abscessus subsp. abscessus]